MDVCWGRDGRASVGRQRAPRRRHGSLKITDLTVHGSPLLGWLNLGMWGGT